MIVEYLKLVNFRNYKNLDIVFDKGINFLYGPNACGKTSVVEAVYFLSITRSFRTNQDAILINNESKSFYIKSRINYGDSKKAIEAIVSNEGKQISIDNKVISKISQLNAVMNAIYFIPKDVNLFRDAPKERRFFLNVNISKNSATYFKTLSSYEKLLKQRNAMLKEIKIDMDLLDVITEKMILLSKDIYEYRLSYINELNKVLKDIFLKITNSNEKLRLNYLTFVKGDHYIEDARKQYKNSLQNDLRTKITNVGVHKEDFNVYLGNKDVGKYGSQGENRLAVLALKLCPYFLIGDKRLKPVVILDDALSELDENHMQSTIKFLKNMDQVFITATEKIEIDKAIYYSVKDGKVLKGE